MTAPDTLRLDPDDLAEVVVDLEQSFAITLPRDLRHIVTAGDLFREVVSRAGPSVG